MYNNENNNENNNSRQYTNPNFTFVGEDNHHNIERVKRRKGTAKWVTAVASGVVVALLGGFCGSYMTYKKMATNKVVDSASYAPPEFASSDDGALTISEAFEKVKPAVVTISTKSIQEVYGGLYSQQVEGLGSGFIINEEGYILTNYHVIANSTDVTVL